METMTKNYNENYKTILEIVSTFSVLKTDLDLCPI